MATAKVVIKEIFKPVSIEVTLESQQELDMFASLFNYTDINTLPGLPDKWCKPISDAAVSCGADQHQTMIIKIYLMERLNDCS